MWTIVAIVWVVGVVALGLLFAYKIPQDEEAMAKLEDRAQQVALVIVCLVWPLFLAKDVLSWPFKWVYKLGQRKADAKKGIVHGVAAENLRPGEVVSMTAKGEFERYKGGDPAGQVMEAERPDA